MKSLYKILLSTLLLVPILAFAGELVNINTADKETLMTVIKGVGEKRAEAIITYREQNGPFKSVDELAEVSGVGQSIVDKNREILKTSK
ncbi:MAG: ComEA family DNA-binding protein [Gammaproteobacteria bacterium]